MEKLQSLLNFTNADGEVITFFDGRITIGQVLAFVIIAVGIILALMLIKGIIIKWVSTGVLIVVCASYLGLASPTQIKDIALQVAQQGISSYQTIASQSDNIKIANGSLQIRADEDSEWLNLSDLKSYVVTGDDSMSIKIGDETVAITDEKVIELIKSFN